MYMIHTHTSLQNKNTFVNVKNVNGKSKNPFIPSEYVKLFNIIWLEIQYTEL